MSDELGDKIKDIGAMFGITEIPDSITDMIGSFLNQQESTENEDKICPNCEQEEKQPNEAVKIIELVNKYQSARASVEDDNNIRLLRALSPYLSKKKRKKIKNCENMLTILKLL